MIMICRTKWTCIIITSNTNTFFIQVFFVSVGWGFPVRIFLSWRHISCIFHIRTTFIITCNKLRKIKNIVKFNMQTHLGNCLGASVLCFIWKTSKAHRAETIIDPHWHSNLGCEPSSHKFNALQTDLSKPP